VDNEVNKSVSNIVLPSLQKHPRRYENSVSALWDSQISHPGICLE